MKNIPAQVLNALHNRGFGDAQIATMEGAELFEEYCEWHGLIGWGEGLWSIAMMLRKRQPEKGQ